MTTTADTVAERQPDRPAAPRSRDTRGTTGGRGSLAARWRDFARPPRLMGIDVARGLAVFGMIGVHVGVAATFEAGSPATWTALVEGRSSILFAVVAGISVALASQGQRTPVGEELRTARLRMAGRAIAVLAIGLILELLGSEIAVILPIYGVLFLLMIPFIGLQRRTLFVTAGALALVGPTAMAMIQALALGSSGAGVQFLITGSYPLTVWVPLMLTGIALGRSPLGQLRTAATICITGVVLAVAAYGIGTAVNGADNGWVAGPGGSFSGSSSAAGLSSGMGMGSGAGSGAGSFGEMSGGAGGASGSYLERLGAIDLGSAVSGAWGVAPHSGGTFEILGSGGFALAIVGACLLLARPLRWVLVPIAAVGSMPLTAYALHVVSFAVLIAPLALAPGLSTWGDTGTSTAFWLGCIASLLVLCTAWALTRGRGPLERVTAWAARRVDRPEARVTPQRSSPAVKTPTSVDTSAFFRR